MHDRDDPPKPPVASVIDAAHTLRSRAEARLGTREATGDPASAERLIHELQVHQIELEMQNAQLRRTQAALEASRARYFDLYDLAPVGYLTLGETGLIEEANLATASLLDSPRNDLIGQPLTHFILTEDQDVFYICRARLWSTGAPQTCEWRLRWASGTSHWVCLDIASRSLLLQRLRWMGAPNVRDRTDARLRVG